MIKATYALVGEVAYKVPDEAVADKIMTVSYTHLPYIPVSIGLNLIGNLYNREVHMLTREAPFSEIRA